MFAEDNTFTELGKHSLISNFNADLLDAIKPYSASAQLPAFQVHSIDLSNLNYAKNTVEIQSGANFHFPSIHSPSPAICSSNEIDPYHVDTITGLSANTSTSLVGDFAPGTNTTGIINIGSSVVSSIDFVGERDWFRVNLTAGRTYRFNLNSGVIDTTLYLRDASGTSLSYNNDFSGLGTNSQISFTATSTGIYYLDAGSFDSRTGSYTLSATDTTPPAPTPPSRDYISGIVNTEIRLSINEALSDNQFTSQELVTLLRRTAANGVTAEELADLRQISSQMSSFIPATSRSYLQYIFNAVVNGNSANQWWTGGQSYRVSLGNLTSNSTELQLNRLVDKWFLGLDRPTNFVGGDTAASLGTLTFQYRSATGSLFVDGVGFSDISQGQAGTCYFLAACSSIASSMPQLISNMFRDNGNGTYGVRFYSSTGSELWVTVDNFLPTLANGNLALAGNASRSLNGELWVALVEKAYAQANEIGAFGRERFGKPQANSYSAVEGGLDEALKHITNVSPTRYGFSSSSQSSVISALSAGRPVWLCSYGNSYNGSTRLLIAGHAFAITSYNSSTQRFTVVNPWGTGGSSSYAPTFQATWTDLFSNGSNFIATA